MTINGPGHDLTVSGNHVTRVFEVNGGGTHLTLDGLTIANGFAAPTTYAPGLAAFGGGLLNHGASVSLDQVVFAGNQAGNGTSFAGGGAAANLGGRFTADHTDFLGDTASSADTDLQPAARSTTTSRRW